MRKRPALDILKHSDAFFGVDNSRGQTGSMGSAAGGQLVKAQDMVFGDILAQPNHVFCGNVGDDEIHVCDATFQR